MKYTFTKNNLVKILKGASIAAGGAAAIALLQFVGAIEIDSPIITSAVALFVPAAINAVKEFMSDK